MRCIRPLKASQDKDGNIVYSSRKAIPGLVPLEFECRKCLPCRLNIAREKAIRTYHEAKMQENSIFLTLTYDEEHLESDRLIYEHFQLFMKRLRWKSDKKLNYMVTGEYGEKNKRPHWHAIIFNYWPKDIKHKYTSDRGDKVWESDEIHKIWKKGACEFGEVTMDSANYVARYAAKKLVHGKDEEHDYHPIHKTSSKRAIGRSWIEKYWKHTFENGFVILPNGEYAKIPRYYVDWCKKHLPDVYIKYATGIREEIIHKAEKKARKEELAYLQEMLSMGLRGYLALNTNQLEERVMQSKFKTLQERLKL